MNKLIHKLFSLLIIVVIFLFCFSSCNQATPPIAMPAPPMINAIMTIDVEGGLVTPTPPNPDDPAPNNVDPGHMITIGGTVTSGVDEVTEIDIYVTNESTEQVAVTNPGEDGTFETMIVAHAGDLITIVAVDPESGQRSGVVSGIVPTIDDTKDVIVLTFGPASQNDYDGDGYSDAADAFPTDPTKN
jgi:hypothetical protein